MTCLLLACSDYAIHKKTEPAAPAGTPEIALTPEEVAASLTCEQAYAEIEISSVGTGILTVSELILDGAWTFEEAPVLPLVLSPGETGLVAISGAGEGRLHAIWDAGEAIVPLQSILNETPALTMTAPEPEAVLDATDATVFTARLLDERLDGLEINWTSDVDGSLGSTTTDHDGVAEFSWDPASRSSGSHVVTASAADQCGAAAQTSVSICQNAGYLAESLAMDSWNFEGDALWDATNGWVQLTDVKTHTAGTAFQTSTIVDASHVEISYAFFVSGGSGADGFSLTALDVDRMSAFVGNNGGGIGYQGLPGWSIEVDTYDNGSHEPTSQDHLSVHLDGDVGGYVASAPLPEMEDGAWHDMSVRVEGTWLEVTVDGVVYLDVDVPELTSFPAYVGFTAATGSLTNYHLIDALEVSSLVCDP